MNSLFRKTSYLLLAASIVITASCSGGGGGGSSSGGVTYSGNLSPAEIDELNALAIGTTAGESIKIANSSSDVPLAITASGGGAAIEITELNKIILSVANTLSLPAGLDISNETCSSGSANITDPGSQASGPIDLTLTFNNCVLIGEDIAVDGKVTIHYDDIANISANFKFTYINFTVTDSSGTSTLNLTIECADTFNCTFSSDFVGSDGETHRVTDFTIFGDPSTGLSGSATFFHGSHGETSISFTGITYGGGCGSIPNGGTINFSSSDGSSGSVTFNGDCTISGSWSNSTSSGDF